MQTQQPSSRTITLVSGFVLVCVAIGIGLWLKFGGTLPLQPEGYRVKVPLPNASALYPGSDVRMAGVDIGKVVAVGLAHDTPLATIRLNTGQVPLRADARAILRTKSPLGEGYLELAPGSRTAPTIPDGGRMAAREVIAAPTLDDVISSFDPAARRHFQLVMGGLSRAFAGREQQVNDSAAEFAPVAANLSSVLGTLNGQSGDLVRLVANGGQMFSILGQRQGQLQAAITAGERMLGATASRDRALSATIAALPSFLSSLRRASTTIDEAHGDLQGAVNALTTVAPLAAPALAQIDATAPSVQSVFDGLPAVIAAGHAGLPSLSRLLRAAGPALGQLYPLSRQLIPVLKLLALVRQSAITTFANVAQIFNGFMVGPGQRLVNYAAGIITVWNESIAGWVKRLPTNRGNTYPQPGALSYLSRGGLKSFDCRNIHNPEYLPPFGSVPPCREQGPWTFDGKTAYYPTLTEAPP
jgi:virulence factor Mce-like protein